MPQFVTQYNDGTNTVDYSFKGAEETNADLSSLKPGDVKVLKIKYTADKEVKVK